MTRLFLRSSVLLVSLCAVALVLLSALGAVRGAPLADSFERTVLAQATSLGGHHTPYSDQLPAVDPPMPGLPFVVSALLAGDRPHLWHVRAIAFLATVALAMLVLSIVQFETGSWTLGAAAASLALLGSALFGPAPGEARPEALALLLVLLGATTIRHTVGALGALAAALPAAAAWFVDPHSGWAVLALLVGAAMSDARRACWFGIATGVLLAAGYVAVWRALGPWFNFAAWDVTWMGWRPDPEAALTLLTGVVLGRFGLCALATVLSCAMIARPWSGRRGLWAVLALGTLVSALVATQRARFDGAPIAPCIVLVCILGTMSLQRIARHLSARFDSGAMDGESVVLVGLSLQFLVLGSLAISTPWVAALVRRTTGI